MKKAETKTFIFEGKPVNIHPALLVPCEIKAAAGDYVLTAKDAKEYRAVNAARVEPAYKMLAEATGRLLDPTLSSAWAEHFRYEVEKCRRLINTAETLCKAKEGDVLNRSRTWLHTFNGILI